MSDGQSLSRCSTSDDDAAIVAQATAIEEPITIYLNVEGSPELERLDSGPQNLIAREPSVEHGCDSFQPRDQMDMEEDIVKEYDELEIDGIEPCDVRLADGTRGEEDEDVADRIANGTPEDTDFNGMHSRKVVEDHVETVKVESATFKEDTVEVEEQGELEKVDDAGSHRVAGSQNLEAGQAEEIADDAGSHQDVGDSEEASAGCNSSFSLKPFESEVDFRINPTWEQFSDSDSDDYFHTGAENDDKVGSSGRFMTAVEFSRRCSKPESTQDELDAIQCPICLGCLCEPLRLGCTHAFCRLCVISWTETTREDGRSVCLH